MASEVQSLKREPIYFSLRQTDAMSSLIFVYTAIEFYDAHKNLGITLMLTTSRIFMLKVFEICLSNA